MDSPPAKRKKTTVEHMDIEPPRQARSTTPPPQHRSHSARISSPLRSNHLSSPHHLHPNKGHSPLRPRSPLPSTPPRSPPHSHSPLPSRSITTPPHQPNSPSEETEEHLEDGCSISSPSGRRRKIGGGGETKHSLVARLKKTLNERLHSVKPVLLAWLQKYLGDQRLSDYVNKLQFHIDPSEFGGKIPVNVVASPIIPNDQTFIKHSQDLSGPILTDYPGIFHESDIPEELKERTESHGIELNNMVAEVLAEIFGKCWDSLGGIIKFHGFASISINGTHKYYDLESRYWIKEAKVE